jgi:predicted RNase H-like HicB family nuclease
MEDDKRSSTIKNSVKYVYWKFEGLWFGHFEKYPEYLSQGETISELREGLLKIHDLIKQGKLKTP